MSGNPAVEVRDRALLLSVTTPDLLCLYHGLLTALSLQADLCSPFACLNAETPERRANAETPLECDSRIPRLKKVKPSSSMKSSLA